jgi:hypothetical protein
MRLYKTGTRAAYGAQEKAGFSPNSQNQLCMHMRGKYWEEYLAQ